MMKAAAMLCAALLLALQGAARRPSPAADAAAVLIAERQWAGPAILLPLAASPDPETSRRAIRALGRLESPALVPQLFALFAQPALADPVATAIAQSLKNLDPQQDPDLIARVADRFRRLADAGEPADAAAIVPLGRLRYVDPQDVAGAERILARLLTRTTADDRLRAVRTAAVRSLESLARANPKLVAFDPATTGTLALIVARTSPNDTPEVRLYALMTLIAGRALEKPSLDVALTDEDEQVRRVAVAALAGNAVAVDEAERAELIARGLEDRSVLVRYESLRGYVRRVARTRGCGPLLDAFRDPSLHVVLAAIDALGDLCQEDDDVTARIAAEARTPPTQGSWHREAHALVALAKRSPERAAIAMPAFRTHPVWQVRMYAARAAAAMKDVVSLERLASDDDDNVREAALAPLQRAESVEAERALVAALHRRDYQLLRSAALLVKDMPAAHRLFAPLLDALLRVTRDRSETSRDTRAALLDAIAVHGARQDAGELVFLLRDFDPAIAAHAADLIARWKGEAAVPEPQPFARVPTAEPAALSCVRLLLGNGRAFRLVMDASSAPITVGHFLALATRDHYYDGLTFHRIVPNFIVQGGSPGANEYSGQKEFMRDEIAAVNARGTAGLSTRGRNTGDAQFYINLVDNPRLDYDYTIFGRVFGPDMRVVDDIQEGDAIARVTPATCR